VTINALLSRLCGHALGEKSAGGFWQKTRKCVAYRDVGEVIWPLCHSAAYSLSMKFRTIVCSYQLHRQKGVTGKAIRDCMGFITAQ